MEKSVKPENIFIGRKRLYTVLIALIFLVLGIFFALLIPLGLIGNLPEDENQALILLSVCTGIFSAIALLFAALNLRNAFFPYILTADEKGIYNYSGLLHFGLIEWKDMQTVTDQTSFLDMLDGDGFSLRIYLKDYKEFKRKLPFTKKFILCFNYGKIKIFTGCSQINKKELVQILNKMYNYYMTPEQTEEH